MSENQKALIKKYFHSLVKQFIVDTDSQFYNITIVFKDYIENNSSGETLGYTKWERNGGGGGVSINPITGAEVPGSRWQNPFIHTFTVTFLNRYENKERWRGTVAHEFAHLYLFWTVGNHEHDERFYTWMDYFEDWLDTKWNLAPRQDKSGDWFQHINHIKREQRKHQFPNNPHQEHDFSTLLSEAERKEYNGLTKLVDSSKNLTELEQHYQTVKNHSLYASGKKITLNRQKNVGAELDEGYNDKKTFLELVSLMKNAKDLIQLGQTYHTAVMSDPLYAKKKSELDKQYRFLKNTLPTSDNLSEGNKPKSSLLEWFLIGGALIIGIGLVFWIFSLLRPVSGKKKLKTKKY